MTAYAPIEAAPAAGTTPWRRQLILLGVAAAAILLAFARDTADVVGIWWRSATFGHCLIIVPLIGWLVWQRRSLLAQLTPRSWAPGLVLVAMGAAGWLLGDAAGVAQARHLGLMFMLQGAVVSLLGPAVSRGLLFPLAYALFLVPFGEELVPPLQTFTAKMCMALLALVGLPAHIDGVFITTPTGYFEVAEACSGVNFLIAMFAYSVLVAHLCFKSISRRIAFVLFAVTSSVVANGVRAWGTIYISHLTSIDFAAGFDHVFYGWFFFAIVLALVMAVGWRFFDRGIDDPAFDPAALAEDRPAPRTGFAIPAALAAILATPLIWSAAIAATGREALPNPIQLPEVAGWQRVPYAPRTPWTPHFTGADHRLLGRYVNARGETVDLAIILYGHQEEGRELIGYGQGSVAPESGWAWTTGARAPNDGMAERIIGTGPVVREVVSFYRLGGVTTGSATRVKLETLKTRLFGGSQIAAAVLVSAEERRSGSARPAIDRFLADLGPVDRLTDRLAAGARGR
jgi:exosortase A